MTAVCELCGKTVTGPAVAELQGMNPVSPEGRMIDYDALSSHMWLHISESHVNQTMEGILQQRRAAKMYAMNWARVPDELNEIRRQHRAQLIMGLSVTTQFAGDQAAGGSSASDNPSDAGDGSNVKKSSRNVSN